MASKLKYILIFTLLFLAGLYFYRKYNVAPAVDIGKLELFNMKGEQVNWQDMKGKKIVLCFGASWCGNCIDEQKAIFKAKQGLLSDVEVIVISDEELERVQGWAERTGYPFTYLKMNSPFPSIGINSIPVTYIINKDLQVKQQEVGYIDWKDEGTVKEILELMD